MRFSCRKAGRLLIVLGLLLLAVLILPSGAWPFCVSAGLICAGICLLRR